MKKRVIGIKCKEMSKLEAAINYLLDAACDNPECLHGQCGCIRKLSLYCFRLIDQRDGLIRDLYTDDDGNTDSDRVMVEMDIEVLK